MKKFLLSLFVVGFLFVGDGVLAAPEDDFVITVTTNIEGGTDATFSLPICDSYCDGYDEIIYNYNVDCNNDGVLEATGQTGNYTCDYGAGNAGTYVVRISGDFPRTWGYGINNSGNEIISLDQWGTQVWASMREAFASCGNLEINATDNPDLSQVTDMDSAFLQVKAINQDINNWDVSNVENMHRMFFRLESFDQNISDWIVRNVSDFGGMFQGTAFNQDIGNWNLNGAAIDVSSMFQEATAFNQDISSWDVSRVQYMQSMFNGATAFNQNIGGWNTSEVVHMGGMFRNATSFNQDLYWNTNKVGYMNEMFSGATAFNGYFSPASLYSNLVNTNFMFSGAISFNQNISAWNVSTVEEMGWMFSGATAFNQDLGDWDIRNVDSMSQMFDGSSLTTPNYNSILIGWSAQSPSQYGVQLGASDVQYCGSEANTARNTLTDSRSWNITDGGRCQLTISHLQQLNATLLYN